MPFPDRSLRYPKWYLHSSSLLAAPLESMFDCSAPSFEVSSKRTVSWSEGITVKQYGQALNETAEPLKLDAIRGCAKVLPQKAFGHMNTLTFFAVSTGWKIDAPSGQEL